MFLDRARGLAALVAVAQFVFFALLLGALPAWESAGTVRSAHEANPLSGLWWPWCFGVALAGAWRCLRAPGGHPPSWGESLTRSVPALVIASGGWSERFLFGQAILDWREPCLISALALLLAGTHWVFPRFLSKIAFPQPHRHRAVLLGNAQQVGNLCELIRKERTLGMEPVAWMPHPQQEDRGEVALACLERIPDLQQEIARLECTHVILACALDAPEVHQKIIQCEAWGLRLVLARGLEEDARLQKFKWELREGWVFRSVRSEPLQNPLNRALKRGTDIAVAVPAILFVVLPVACLTWWMQRRQSPGPLFYRQWRHGRGNCSFRVWKFRTMHLQPEREAVQASRTDPRVYPFGAWLRRHSLDELPQFLNVLTGQMSVVGPRPHFVEHTSLFSKEASYLVRHFVKPGVTGLAQVNGCRGEVFGPEDLQRRIAWDLQYVENWNLWLDCKLIARTVAVVLHPPESAY